MINLKSFLEYLGPVDSLYGYNRSYKMVLLIYMLELADNEGNINQDELYENIHQYYVKRNNKNLKVELSDSAIQKEISNLTVATVKKTINSNAFNVIKNKGFINKKIIDDITYIYFVQELWKELKYYDTDKLKGLLKEKLELYYKNYVKDGEIHNMSTEKIINHITKYISAQGFKYDKDEIKNFYLSLKSKPFVLLAGISGTGKSKLAQLFAEAVGATSENGRYNIIPVRPDWSDPSDLLGYRNIEGCFQPGPLTTAIKNAVDNPELPYFICLDEMNLARVEYYFSDILSIIETRKIKDKIVTDKLFKSEFFGNDTESKEKYSNLYIPDNLYIIGTVNMDETTFPFSKKVLDRANTIEFNKVNLNVDFDIFNDNSEEIEPINIDNKKVSSKYIKLADCIEERDHIEEVVYILEKINDILEEVNLQFGYRIRDEITFYSLYAVNEKLMDFNKSMDYAIKQKILPRIQGSNLSIKKALIDLFVFFVNDNSTKYDPEHNNNEENMSKYIKENTVNYPLCAEKIWRMVRRYETDGFTTFWE